MKRALIVIDGNPNDRDSLNCAAEICRNNGAALTVAAARLMPRAIGLFGGMIGGTDEPASEEEITAAAQAAYKESCGKLENAEFIAYEAEGAEIIAAIGHAYDVVLVERISREDGPEVDPLAAALFETGRPALVTPPGRLRAFGRRIAVNWNGTVQVTRAIGSTMALLSRAEEVVLLLGSGMEAGPPLPIADYMRVHGANVSVRRFDSDQMTARGRARALLGATSDAGADLLVTGAYGHGGEGYRSLGRATQKVVSGAKIPVLLQS